MENQQVIEELILKYKKIKMVLIEEFFAININHLKQIIERVNKVIDQESNTVSMVFIGDPGQMLPIQGHSIFKFQS